MSDNSVEKSFLYLLVLSLVLHAGVIALLYYMPAARPQPKEPVFIDLQQMPQPPAPQKPSQQETRRQSDRRVRVERETAPRGLDARESTPPRTTRAAPAQPRQTQPPAAPRPAAKEPDYQRESPLKPGSSASHLLRPRTDSSAVHAPQPQLFPGASRMAKLEESYRKKYERDIAEGDTRFLNSDDIQFGSFLRRFENAIYGVWRYPQEAAMKGIEGITPVRITFNRKGEIVGTQLLESSGARILDDEVFRTLKMIGPVGGFPKGYDKDEFHLIAFFQYGGARRSLR